MLKLIWSEAHWEHRAEEARLIGELVRNADYKRVMAEIADAYEDLARLTKAFQRAAKKEQQYRARDRYVIGPDGSPLTVADLPPKDTKRWVIRRKAQVVAAVRGGLLSLEEACERYTLTVDEFLSWQRSIDRYGLPGLRATRIQDYRPRGTPAATCQSNRET
jgi:hypothetical protein